VIPQIKDIELDFKATSITILNNNIYISDNKKTIYLLKDGNPSVWWTCKDKGPIYRIWAYQDSIMALVNHSQDFNNDVFVSYRIKDGEIIKTWNGAVLPMGKGLIWSDISMPPDLTEESNRWSATQVADGTPDLLFPGMDPLASLRAEVVPWCDGVEIIAFSGATGRLMVFSKDKTNPKKKSMGWWQKTKNALSGSEDPIWSSEAQFSRLPLFIKQVYIEKTSKGMDAEPKEREVDYFIPPRILVDSGNMIAIDNNQGLWSIIDKATYFKSCQLRLYSWNGTDFTESFLMKSSFGYCVDITIKDGSVLALIVTDQGTKLRTVSLKANIT
jgi:hypothetical protein